MMKTRNALQAGFYYCTRTTVVRVVEEHSGSGPSASEGMTFSLTKLLRVLAQTELT
jgi:hypothetical protein